MSIHSVGQKLYGLLSKSFKYEVVRWAKRKLRPLKHMLVGKEGIYRAIDMIKELEHKGGRETLTVFDIGAADGEYALTFLNSFPKATVYCFEPQSRSYAKLKKRIVTYKDRARPFQLGFYNKGGDMTFHLMSYPDSSSLLPLPPWNQKVIGTETVPIARLDDFTREKNISRIDFMKIDVESTEREVVEGGAETLTKKVDNLYIEIALSRKGVYSSNYLEVLKLINSAGFTLVEVITSGEASDFLFSKLVKRV